MSRRNPEPAVDLDNLIDNYKVQKDEENKLKKLNQDLSDAIKNGMNELGVNKFSSKNWTASVTVTQKETFNEDRAIEILKGLPNIFDKVVKSRFYIDEEELEKVIYSGELDATLLADCKEVGKPISTLRITKKKEEN